MDPEVSNHLPDDFKDVINDAKRRKHVRVSNEVNTSKHNRSTSNNRPGVHHCQICKNKPCIHKEKYKQNEGSGPITVKSSKLPAAFVDKNYKGKRSMKSINKPDK